MRVLVGEAPGERQRADDPVPEPPDVGLGGGEVTARRGEIAAMEADHGGDAEVAARRGGLLQVIVEDVSVGQCVVPPPGVENSWPTALCAWASLMTAPTRLASSRAGWAAANASS